MSIIFYIITAAAVGLHVLSHFLPRFGTAVTVFSVLLHAAGCALLLFTGAAIEEAVLFLLVSAFVSLFIGGREEGRS